MKRRIILTAFSLLVAFTAAAQKEVVVYTSLDELFSKPILDTFEKETGITVKAAYDEEANKTTGLVNRIIAEQRRPRADVYWNNEVAQTIVLKDKGVLVPYDSPSAKAIPARFKDPEHYWTGFAARARVIIYNTDLVKDPPTSILDFLKPEWKGKAAIAKPLFGTTATHAAALFALWGAEKAKGYFRALLANGVAVLPGNAQVRDMVARGRYSVGLTDTDDANGAIADGLPAKWLFPDQGPGEMGTLLIPNTLAIIKGAPHPEAAKALVDYLLSPEVETRLAHMRSIQIPLNPAAKSPDTVPDPHNIKTLDVTWDAIAKAMPESMAFMREVILR